MNYELAKELKDAGFPGAYGDWHEFDQEILQSAWDMYRAKFSPTLEELIDACGNGFANLEREDEGIEEGGVQWIAFNSLAAGEGGTGETPEIAVAKLWLALHTI